MTGMTRSNLLSIVSDSVRIFWPSVLCLGLILIALNVHVTASWAQGITTPVNPTNTNEMDGLPSELPTYIILDDPKQMGELFKRLSKPDFQLLRPSPLPDPAKSSEVQIGFIRSMQINGRVEGNTATLRLDYEIEQIKAGKVWTRIGLDGISLQSVQSSGKNMIATMIKDKSWAVQTENVGVHKIEVRIALDVISDRSTKRILFSIPESPSTSFMMEVPENVLFATTNNRDQLALKYDETRRSFVISSMLSPRSKIDIKWLGQSLLVREDSQKVECRGLISLRLDADTVSTRQFWQIIPISGLVRELHFDLNADVMVTDIQINGQAVKSMASNLASGKIRMTIKVPENLLLAQKDPVTCEIVTKESYSESNRKYVSVSRQIQWSAPVWKDAAITSGIIALEYPEKWFNLTGASQQLIPVDSRDLPDRLKKSNALTAFQFNDTLQNIDFKVRAKSSPILTKSFTIGVVRDHQVEYVTEIELLGEMVKSADYHLKLGLGSQILFVGPRDLWEGYDLIPSDKDSRFVHVKITPNKTSNPSGKQIVRVRYMQRIDSKTGFDFSSPVIAESKGSQNIMWLVAKPGFDIVTTDKMFKARTDISPDSIKSLALLLDQSISDNDRWLNSNLIRSGVGLFHQSFSDSETIKVKPTESPPHLTYHQSISLVPESKSINVKYKFDCLIDSGQLSIIKIQNKNLAKRGESYQITINGKRDASHAFLVFDGDIAEIKMDTPLHGKNEIVIESSDNAPKIYLEDFLILNGDCASRRILVQSASNSRITLPENYTGWQKALLNESQSSGIVTTDSLAKLPVLEWVQFHNTFDPKKLCVVEKIQSFYDSHKPDLLSVFYTIQSEATELTFPRVNGLEPFSSLILNRETGIIKTDSGYKIPLNQTSKRFVLAIQYRHDTSTKSFEIPLPKECDANDFIPSQLICEADEYHFPCLNPFGDLYKSMVPTGTHPDDNVIENHHASHFRYESVNPNKPFTIYLVNILIPCVIVVLITISLLSVFAWTVDKQFKNLFVLGFLSVCLSLYLNEKVNIWFISAFSVGTSVHLIFTRCNLFRSNHGKSSVGPNQDSQPIVTSVMENKPKEPSTVLKYLSKDVSLQVPHSQIIDQAWSVSLDSEITAPDSKITEVIKSSK